MHSYPRLASFLTALICVAPAFAAANNNVTYLALGESISFGLNPLLFPTSPSQPLPTPDQFIGYPEIVAQIDHLPANKEMNLSCPGETSGSFLDTKVLDYGCNSPHPNPPPLLPFPPFKTWIGLHTPYTGAQMDFAMLQLTSNKRINFVTLSIGGNDILLLIAQCFGDPVCVNAGLPAVLQTFGGNLETILTNIRSVYTGKLVMVTYYAPSPAFAPLAVALNSAILQVASHFDVKIAHGFEAFQLLSIPYGGDACQAGLVFKFPDGTCDVHPTLFGQQVLAATVEIAKN